LQQLWCLARSPAAFALYPLPNTVANVSRKFRQIHSPIAVAVGGTSDRFRDVISKRRLLPRGRNVRRLARAVGGQDPQPRIPVLLERLFEQAGKLVDQDAQPRVVGNSAGVQDEQLEIGRNGGEFGQECVERVPAGRILPE
jgi:hypothetical protein